MGDLGPFTSETWIKETARLQLTPSHSSGAAPALHGQTVKRPRAVFSGPRAEDGAAARPAAPGSSSRGADDSHGGPGAGRDPESHPRRSAGPLLAAAGAGTREPAAPREAGRRRGESRAASGPRRRSQSPRAAKEDQGAPPAAQRLLRRAKDFRSNGLGPERRNCTHTAHAATDRAVRPRPLASPGPTWGLGRRRGNVRAEDRENRCAACPRARLRGLGLRRAGARASPAEDPSGKPRGWGSPRGGAGGVPGAPGSAAVLRFSRAS